MANDNKEREDNLEVQKFNLEIVKTVGIGLTALGLVLSGWKGFQECQLTRERLIIDRFSQSTEMLESQEISIRVGGIYILEQVAQDSPSNYHWSVMELLTVFIRTRSPHEPNYLGQYPQPNTDVQAALTVISRGRERIDPRKRLNLTDTNLAQLDFSKANLREADLAGSTLERADLQRADLQEANLTKTSLYEANLWGANLWRANLEGANLWKANLEGAVLEEAVLEKVKDLTPEQIKSACFWQKAIYKDDAKANKKFIGVLENDSASNPKEPIDCSGWKRLSSSVFNRD